MNQYIFSKNMHLFQCLRYRFVSVANMHHLFNMYSENTQIRCKLQKKREKTHSSRGEGKFFNSRK